MIMKTKLLVPAILAVILCLIYYTVNLARRSHFFDKFHRRHRRVSGASTPPRRLPLEKKVEPNEPPSTDYRSTLPPSTTESLAEVVSSLPPEQRNRFDCSMRSPDEILKNMMPFDVPFGKWGARDYTPTGISAEEIHALGDFPDYAKLSSVPLPQAFPEFDINRAMPRPYRPLRWAYHQTMCKWHDTKVNLHRNTKKRANQVQTSTHQTRTGLVVRTRTNICGTNRATNVSLCQTRSCRT